MALPNGVYGHAEGITDLENKGNQDLVIPIFYMEKQLNKSKSQAAGRAIFDEYEAARFIIPGDNTFEHKERVSETMFTDDQGNPRPKWRARYDAFKAGIEQIDGMPLEAWYKIVNHPGLIEEMRALKIRSVEDLAGISDQVVTMAPWGREWRKLALEEVDARKTKDTVVAANAELTAQLAEMQKQLAALTAAAAAAPAAPKGKGGRPRKVAKTEGAAA